MIQRYSSASNLLRTEETRALGKSLRQVFRVADDRQFDDLLRGLDHAPQYSDAVARTG